MPDLIEDIAQPISDSQPSGEDISKLDSSDPRNEEWILKYSELRELTRKIATNCESIVDVTQSILTEKSKDLTMAGHLSNALLHQKGFPGLSEGLKVYHILLQNFWDKGLYPQKDRVRSVRLKALDKSLATDISAQTGEKEFFVPAEASDAEALEEIKGTIDAIVATLKEKLSESDVPMMDNLTRAVNARLKVLGPVKKPEPPKKEEKPQEKGIKGLIRKTMPSRQAQEETEVAVATEEEPVGLEIASEVDAARTVVRAAKFLLQKVPTSVVPYRLVRSALWYSLPLFNPEPNRSGKRVTQFFPPSGKAMLAELLKEEDWESLIIQCEAVFVDNFEAGGGGCFCLDIQRFLCTAVKELMSKATEAGDARTKDTYGFLQKTLLQDTAIFLDRFPYIVDLLYSDGTPFVDAQTKNWIEKTVKPVLAASGGQQGTAGNVQAGDSQISEDFEKALDLLAKQKWEDAVGLMQISIDTEASRRGRFLRRLNLASLCIDATQPSMARPILEQLDEEISDFSLDQWEPSICVQVWNNLKRCYQELMSQQENDGIYQEKADRIFEKICRLDIRAALTSSAK